MTTRKEITGVRDLYFSDWIRNFLPDSGTGYMVTDIDFVLYNFKTKQVMLIEVKTRNSEIKTWQKNLLTNFNKWIKKGMDKDWTYLGCHLITFENSTFDDGKVYLNGEEISEDALIEFMAFPKVK